jgi:molybdate transport system regulatory protein
MNILNGIIEEITVNGALSLAYIRVGETRFTVIVIDTPATVSYLRAGNPIQVIFKETEVIIGKGTGHQVSLQNKLVGQIHKIESGALLSKIILETSAGRITSVITTNAVKKLQLKEGNEVTAMIKTNEIMISE